MSQREQSPGVRLGIEVEAHALLSTLGMRGYPSGNGAVFAPRRLI
jgi:hypothetical protein